MASQPHFQVQTAFAGPQAGHPEEGFPPAEEDSPLFRSDDFRIWCMKVIPCTKRFVHDWTVCPFAHAGEKAVRRDPRTHNYTGIACPDMKKQSSCIRGDKCPYAHNVFEYWLHPTRYRTQLCNDGPTCKRSICFFAHSLEELRVPAVKPYVSPEALARASLEAIQQNPHPLGQQLPNPAVAMRAASGQLCGSSSGTPRAGGPVPYSPHASPHAAGGRSGPSGPAPGHGFPGQALSAYGMQQQQQQFMGGQLGGAMGPYGMPPPQIGGQPQRMSAPGARSSADLGRRLSLEGVKLSLTPSTPQWGAEAMGRNSQGYPGADSLGFPPSPAPAQGWVNDFSSTVGSLPNSMGCYPGGPASAGYNTAPPSCRPSYDAYGGTGTPSAAMASAVQRLSGNSLGARGSHDSLLGLGAGAEGAGVAPVRPSYTSDSGEERAGSPQSDGASSAGQATVPATTELDLAQSLATLKIALTQQHVAAASGSNHEIVISTLHQILKDAVAQHGGKIPNFVMPGQQQQGQASPPAAAATAPNPSLAASSAFYASAGGSSPALLEQSVTTASASPPPAALTTQRLSAGVGGQPWISTIGEIKWEAAPVPVSPNSTAEQTGLPSEPRLSGGSDE